MEPQIQASQHIQSLILARTLPNDYQQFIEPGFTTDVAIARAMDLMASRPDSSKYQAGVKAKFEMSALDEILVGLQSQPESRGKVQLENALGLVRQAQANKKPHLAIDLLSPLWRTGIEIPYDEVKQIARDFLLNSTCESYHDPVCVLKCPHGVVWGDDYSCRQFVENADQILRHYSDSQESQRYPLELLEQS
jgi:hypothetical protein